MDDINIFVALCGTLLVMMVLHWLYYEQIKRLMRIDRNMIREDKQINKSLNNIPQPIQPFKESKKKSDDAYFTK